MTQILNSQIGKNLRNKRLEKDLTLEGVSQEIRIHKRFLNAMEEDKWNDFPARVYLEGFLRQYALFLGLDDEEIIRQLHQEKKDNSKPDFKQPSPPTEITEISKEFPSRLRAFLLLAIFFILTGLYFFNLEVKLPFHSNNKISLSETPIISPGKNKTENPHEFRIHIKEKVWLRAWVNGQVRFEGTLKEGVSKFWTGNTLRLQTKNLSLLDVFVNGEAFYLFSEDAPGEIHWPIKETSE